MDGSEPDCSDVYEIAELAALLVDAIEGEDPDWMLAYEWLRDAVRGEAVPQRRLAGPRVNRAVGVQAQKAGAGRRMRRS